MCRRFFADPAVSQSQAHTDTSSVVCSPSASPSTIGKHAVRAPRQNCVKTGVILRLPARDVIGARARRFARSRLSWRRAAE